MKFSYEAAQPGVRSLTQAFMGGTRQKAKDDEMKSLANIDFLRARMGESDAKAGETKQRTDYLGDTDTFVSQQSGAPIPLVQQFSKFLKEGNYGTTPPLTPNDEQGNVNAPTPITEIPQELAPFADKIRNALQTYSSTKGSSTSNPQQIAQAGGEYQGQDATRYVQNLLKSGDVKSASAYNQGSKLGNEIKDSENIARIGAQSRVDVADKRQIPTPAQKMKGDKDRAKELTHLDVADKFTSSLITNIDQLIGSEDGSVPPHPGLSGVTGYIDSNLPPLSLTPKRSEDQANARALVNSLLSKTSVQGLTGIRSTGTAPGSITEREWPIFQNTIATVDPSQGTSQFTQQLKDLRTISKELRNNSKSRFDERFGAEDQKQTSTGGTVNSPRGGLSAEEQAELEQLRKEMKSGR